MKRKLFLQTALVAGVGQWIRPANAQDDRLRIGLTAVILADQAAFLARWADYLSRLLGVRVEFAARDSYQAILALLFAGKLDAAWICGYPYVRFQPQLRLLAVPLYQGRPHYQSYLIRPRGPDGQENSIAGWKDLRGKVFAYSDPLSNSGWLVAQGQMAAVGIGPRDLMRGFFAHGHRNVAEAVGARLADAGSIDGYVWETMHQQNMAAAGTTEIIWKSPLHAFPPLVAPAAAGHPKLDQLQASLLAMAQHPPGQPLLKALNLDGFVPGSPGLFESIRRLAQSVPGSGVAG